MTTLLLGVQLLFAAVGLSLAANATNAENRASPLTYRFGQHPANGARKYLTSRQYLTLYESLRPLFQATKGIPGLESVMGVMGPLALAAMVSLPFVAPAAAALLPLASISGVFGRRRRHLEDARRKPIPDADILMRKIHAAATRRNVL